MSRAINISCSLTIFFLVSCAPSRYVKPLNKGESAMSFSFGGPLIRYSGAPLPIPFTTLGYGYGVTEGTTLFGNIHTTSLLFGNLQADMGACISILSTQDRKKGITFGPAIQLAYHPGDSKSFRLWPSFEINGYFPVPGKSSFFYAGPETWLELSTEKAHGEKQQETLIPNLHAGFCTNGEKWSHQMEIKWLSPGTRNQPGVVDYVGLKKSGALGLFYCVYRKF